MVLRLIKLLEKSDILIIMLTARGEVMDRVVGLEIGANDYLSKPFEPRGLVARIHNILKPLNSVSKTKTNIQFDDLLISNNYAKLNQQDLKLTQKELRLLLMFVQKLNEFFNREEIM